MERLGAIVRQLMERLAGRQSSSPAQLAEHWEEAVGPELAAHARPVRLRRDTLVVEVESPAWMQELQLRKHEVRGRLNAALGKPRVRELFLVLASSGRLSGGG